jgi:hypothetical protein
MRHTIGITAASLVAAACVATATSSASAQERTYVTTPLEAPSNALELKVGTGYTQGFGLLTPSQSIPDVAGAGLGVDADIDYRASPGVSVGVQGEYQEFANNTNANQAARGMAGNIGVTGHFAPYQHGDPWVRFGTGYRLLWNVDPNNGSGTTLIHGFEVGKLTLGYDLRPSAEVAIAPVIGADLDIFGWQEQGGVNTTLSSAQVGFFVFGGLQGRFDIGEKTGQTTMYTTAAQR